MRACGSYRRTKNQTGYFPAMRSRIFALCLAEALNAVTSVARAGTSSWRSNIVCGMAVGYGCGNHAFQAMRQLYEILRSSLK